ncbi:MAG: hypothetical protein V1735_02180 [Nanoarchaeota archaeon]
MATRLCILMPSTKPSSFAAKLEAGALTSHRRHMTPFSVSTSSDGAQPTRSRTRDRIIPVGKGNIKIL